MKKRVLIVEDDAPLAEVLRHNLSHEGFEVEWAADGNRAVTAAKAFAPDLVLLDLTLPGRSGMELCSTWAHERRFPVIMLTSRDRKVDTLRGLEIGADDYVTKPFDLDELLARIHAVLRRARPAVACLTIGALTVDLGSMTVSLDGVPVDLTHKEFELLRYLAERPNTVVHRDELLRAIWGFPEDPITRTVDRTVARLRKKIEQHPHKPTFIHTAHGDGYYLAGNSAARESAARGTHQ